MRLEVRIQTADFAVDEVLAGIRARQRSAGAVVTFVGLVRERTQAAESLAESLAATLPESSVESLAASRAEPPAQASAPAQAPVAPSSQALYLEHYPGVTERSIEAFARQAQARWPLLEVIVVHRVGWLEPTAQIVLVVTVSSHRAAAFAAAAFLMDYLKTDAVLWKKERHADGGETWLEATHGDQAAINLLRYIKSISSYDL